MSDLSTKLEAPRGTSGTAQASADALLRRWGSRQVSENEISITYSGHSSLWRRAVGAALFSKVPEGDTNAASADSEA